MCISFRLKKDLIILFFIESKKMAGKLIGYTFAYGRKESYEESEAYLDEIVNVYSTLKSCYNAIKDLFEERLDEITWIENVEEEITAIEGKSWNDGWEIGWFDIQFYGNAGIFIKCVFMHE